MANKQLPTVRIVVEFDPFTADRLKASAAERGQTVSVWIRRAVIRELNETEQKQ